MFILLFINLLIPQTFKLHHPGSEEIVNYEKYGRFKNVGTSKYKYTIINKQELKKAVGEGIFPNTESVLHDPQYIKMKNSGILEGNHWNFINTDNYQANFYKWATAPEEPGQKLFYTALSLEKSGNLIHAIKAYYAIVIHFPNSFGKTYWNTPWYVGPTSIDKIHFITRNNPQLKIKLIDARIQVVNKFDDNVNNDRFIVNPGKLITKPNIPQKIKNGDITKKIGKGICQLVQYSNNHWQVLINEKPTLIKAIAYQISKVGTSPDTGTLSPHRDWMIQDFNNNKILDVYETWVDKNFNNKKDPDEKNVGDFQLMKEMGVNAIRVYHHGYNKKLLQELYEKFGIMVLMGDFLGMYTIGSGAGWYEGTDYTNPAHKENMIESVKEMVNEYKDEPYVLMWILGNENNYGVVGDANSPGTGCRAKEQPQDYYRFVNEVAKIIKSIDPYKRPVAICNGDLLFLDIFAKYCDKIDVFGANVYRGAGFGNSFWQDIKDLTNKPVLITEYGCPAYAKGKSKIEIEQYQSEYHKQCWLDILYNSGDYDGVGNAIGGVVFEWIDEWWKAGPPPNFDPSIQETKGNFQGPFYDGWFYEEWLGIASQGNGTNSPFLRQLRKVYFTYKDLWKE